MKVGIDKKSQIELVNKNISQLLYIALYNTDEHIENHFGGEIELLQVINGYIDLLDRLRGELQ